MDDWSIDNFGDIGAVAAGASLRRVGGETNLVINNDVKGTTGSIAWKLGEIKYLGNDALPRNSGISMDKDR